MHKVGRGGGGSGGVDLSWGRSTSLELESSLENDSREAGPGRPRASLL